MARGHRPSVLSPQPKIIKRWLVERGQVYDSETAPSLGPTRRKIPK
jgi:hypothetical protein